ncbi:SAM-dependent methyltransferase [Kitasatospora sp. NPDC088779]|uniref:SAM-dependent methyltransferase n=1 Tax=Kitasatospora sp. NPDC088779 TaxID=3154964 RepID=UPI0034374E00
MITTAHEMAQPDAVEEFDGIELNLHRPQSARVEDYLLGGIGNFPADREEVGLLWGWEPGARRAALQRKAFRKAVLAWIGSCGPMQILDLGCGLPLPHWWDRAMPGSVHHRLLGEVHELAAPGSRVVYVDRDPIVMSHARALLRGNGTSEVRHVRADLAEVGAVLGSGLISSGEPVALTLFDVLHEVEDARRVVTAYTEVAAPGSLLAISHRSLDHVRDSRRVLGRTAMQLPFFARSREEFTALFDGWELLGPGVVPVQRWSASRAPGNLRLARAAGAYGAVARKR